MENTPNNPPENTPHNNPSNQPPIPQNTDHNPQSPVQPGQIPYNKPKAPNSTLVLVLGILSIPSSLCCCLGMIFGIVALVTHNQSMTTYNQNPDAYQDPQNLRIGKICAIIGIALGVLSIVFNIVYYFIMAASSGLDLF